MVPGPQGAHPGSSADTLFIRWEFYLKPMRSIHRCGQTGAPSRTQAQMPASQTPGPRDPEKAAHEVSSQTFVIQLVFVIDWATRWSRTRQPPGTAWPSSLYPQLRGKESWGSLVAPAFPTWSPSDSPSANSVPWKLLPEAGAHSERPGREGQEGREDVTAEGAGHLP